MPATSSGRPNRPSGTSAAASWPKNSSAGVSGARLRWMFSHCGVSTKPMFTLLTRMPSWPSSIDSALDRLRQDARFTEEARNAGSG